jgi:hypothetical protein
MFSNVCLMKLGAPIFGTYVFINFNIFSIDHSLY